MILILLVLVIEVVLDGLQLRVYRHTITVKTVPQEVKVYVLMSLCLSGGPRFFGNFENLLLEATASSGPTPAPSSSNLGRRPRKRIRVRVGAGVFDVHAGTSSLDNTNAQETQTTSTLTIEFEPQAQLIKVTPTVITLPAVVLPLEVEQHFSQRGVVRWYNNVAIAECSSMLRGRDGGTSSGRQETRWIRKDAGEAGALLRCQAEYAEIQAHRRGGGGGKFSFKSSHNYFTSCYRTMSTTTTSTPATDFSKSTLVGETRWLRLEALQYTDQTGRERKWGRAVRTTKQSETGVDAVAIFATLRNLKLNATSTSQHNSAEHAESESDEKTLLVKQFRPAINAYTLELPAGLVDRGETPEQAALRELKEETGYVGKIVERAEGGGSGFDLPATFLSPGLSNESVLLVPVEVVCSLEENKNPKQQLEEGEFCERILVNKWDLLVGELGKLRDEHNQNQEAEAKEKKPKLEVFCALWTLAYGMEIGRAAAAAARKKANI
eukprot:g19921.t1